MSYTKLMKLWEKESKLKDIQMRQQRKEQKEKELERADELFMIQMREEKRKLEEYEHNKKRIIKTKDDLLLQLRNNNHFSYQQYLIVWDIITHNYCQIESDVTKGKIDKYDIMLVFDFIKNFSAELINDYWYNKLTETSV